jgi:hypothetical protein
MAGYIGTKAVNLSTTGADINGNANIDGTLDVTGNVDLNGGTIDGTVIGGTTPAAITGTTGTFSGDLTVDTSTLFVDASTNRVGVGTTSPSYNLDVQSSGDTVLYVKSTGTGDADAVVVLDAADTGEAVVMFRIDGTEKASIEWYDAGQDLNIITAAGTNGGIDFQPNNSLALRIDSSGNVLVGKTAQDFGVTRGFEIYQANGDDVLFMTRSSNPAVELNRLTDTGSIMRFKQAGTVVGYISVTGSTTAYVTSSDYRLKENITPVQGAADIVKAMQPVTYTFKSDGSWHDGFLAHELQELHPRAVTGEKDAMKDEEYEVTPAVEATYDDEGVELTPAVPAVMGTRSVPDYQGVDYSKLTPVLTAALKEALNKIDALEAQNAAFEARLTALEATP